MEETGQTFNSTRKYMDEEGTERTFESTTTFMAEVFEVTTKVFSQISNETTFNASGFIDTSNLTFPDENVNTTSADILVNRTSEDIPFFMDFRDEPWVIPLVSISLFNVAAIVIFEIYVLYKYCTGRRHLFLGQILLFGLLLCSLLALLYVPKPHWLFCGITRAGIGLAYAIVFGTLLVKCVFLLKIHDGVYFNAPFQAFLLFFIVAVEVAILTQWLVYSPPRLTSVLVSGEMTTACETGPLERIEYLTYVMLLVFLVIVSSVRARGLRENNREALYIGLSIAFSLVFFVAWISVAVIFDRRYDAPAEAFGLCCTALVVFLLIFLPKAAHLASRRSERGSTNHSVVHTPSFLHLQPHAVLPHGTQGSTLVKHQNSHLNADYCRGGYSSRLWRYDCPSFHQMEPPQVPPSDMNSLKKSMNGSSYNHSHLY